MVDENLYYAIKEQLERGDMIERGELEDLAAPELWIDPKLTDLQDIDDKELSNVKILKYKHHGPIKFPLAQ